MHMRKSFELRESAPLLEIRTATYEDAEGITRTQHDSWLATYPDEESGITVNAIENRFGDPEKRLTYWRDTIENLPANVQIYTVHQDGAIIGFCKVSKGENEGHVDSLFLDPSKKKQGAGGAVFRKGLEWLGDERPISLEVVAYNDDAIAFYEHFGFKSTSDGKKVELPDGKIMPYLVMRKPSRDI